MKRQTILLLLFCFSVRLVCAQVFTDIISSTGLNSSQGYICDFIDFDSDGFEDIIYKYQGFSPELYRNNGDLTFTNYHAISGLPVIDVNAGITAVDFDNDNDEDVILSLANGSILIYENNNGLFQDVTSGLGVASLGNLLYPLGLSPIQYILPFDYDLDGYLDLLVSRNSGSKKISVLRNAGGNDFTLLTDLATVPSGIDPSFVRVFDFDNDNDFDIIYVNKTVNGGINNDGNFTVHPIILLENVGGIYNDVSSSSGFTTNVYARAGASFIDYDKDGFTDIVFGSDNCCAGNYGVTIYKNNGNGTFLDVTASLGIDALAGNNRYYWDQTEVDFDNDGDYDFYFGVGADNITVYNELWVNDGGAFTEQSALLGLDFANVNLAAGVGSPYWFDIENDGDLDVFVQSGNSNSALYIKNGSGANYISIAANNCSNSGTVEGVSIIAFDNLGFSHFSSNKR